jgi:hypothetical protein
MFQTCLLSDVQGGLPTFLDIGQSFSASAITEDNLLQQLLAQNKRLVRGTGRWEPASAPAAPADLHAWPAQQHCHQKSLHPICRLGLWWAAVLPAGDDG